MMARCQTRRILSKGLRLELGDAPLPLCPLPSIHLIADKVNSRKFGVASDPPDPATVDREGHGGTSSSSKRRNQVAFVAPSCSERLRLVTTLLPRSLASLDWYSPNFVCTGS